MCWSIWINYRKPLLSAKAVCDDELWRVFVWKWSDTLNTGQKHFWLLPSLTMLTYRYSASLLIFAVMMIVLLFFVFKIAYFASLESSYFLVFCLYLAMYLVMLFLDDFTILLFNLFNSWVVRSLSEFPRIWNDVHHTISWKELTCFILLVFRSWTSTSREHISHDSRFLIECSVCCNSSKNPMWASLNQVCSSFSQCPWDYTPQACCCFKHQPTLTYTM